MEATLSMGGDDARQQGHKKRKSKLPQRKCPLKCHRKSHTNGSVYFCSVWKTKDLEEKKELVKKIPLCILCLARDNKDHECPVRGKCQKCGGHHNISICPRNEEEAALKIGENEDDSDDPSMQTLTTGNCNIIQLKQKFKQFEQSSIKILEKLNKLE